MIAKCLRWLLCLVLMLTALSPLPAAAEPSSILFPETGYSVVDSPNERFLAEFKRHGGVATLGYPVSHPFDNQGFTYQVFQRGALQWRPDSGQAYLANVMDWLSDAGKDKYLAGLGIPRPLTDSGGTWEQVVAERESWLTEPAIAGAYRNGGGYVRFGLPTSRPEQAGPFVVQRFQRYAFQLWTADVPGMPARGTVVGILAGTLLKEAGLIPVTPSAQPAINAACVSNSSSAVQSLDVDIVRYRFVSLGFDRVGLEVTPRNNCDEPRSLRFRARVAPPSGGSPVALGREVEVNFAPREEKTLIYDWESRDGTYPAIGADFRVTFRWNWSRQGATELHCLDVGADRCLRSDPWLRSTVEDLSTQPAGLALLRSAASAGVTLRYGTLPPDLVGGFRPITRTITLANDLKESSEYERGAILAHELKHAADYTSGVPMLSGAPCLQAEERAFRVSAEVWYAFWAGVLPNPPQDGTQANLNEVTRMARNDPSALDELIAQRYSAECRVPFDAD